MEADHRGIVGFDYMLHRYPLLWLALLVLVIGGVTLGLRRR